jgi:hypothetical protein
MLQKHPRLRATLLSIALIPGVLLVGLFFEPELVSTYWHMRFGDSTTFQGWTIPVPKGWWVSSNNSQLIVQKMLRFYEHRDPPSIIVEAVRPSNPVDPETLKKELIYALTNQGYSLQEDRPIHIGTHPGYCLHFINSTDPNGLHISCESMTAQLSLDFFGRHSEIQNFYLVLDQLKEPKGTRVSGPGIG